MYVEIISIALFFITSIYCFSVLSLIFGLFKLRRGVNSTLHTFSVVIAVHNEEHNLEKCLKRIVAQDYPSDKFEVILADDRSTDATPDIINRYCHQYHNFKYVQVKPDEPAIPKKTALSKALDIAQGEIILSTDGDCIQHTGWISAMNRHFTDGVGMVIGHVGYFKPENVWQGIDALDYLTHRALGAAFIGLNSVYTCTAANMAYRKDIFEQNRNAFRELKIRPAEDNFFLHCTKNLGYKISVATEPESIVETPGAQNFSHFMNQRFRWAAYGGNITTFGVKLFFIPTLLFYVLILLSLLTALFTPKIFPLLGIVVLNKMFFDFLFITRYVHLYRINYMLKHFIPLSFFHLILAPLVALKGNLFSFTWKNRKYTREYEIRESAVS